MLLSLLGDLCSIFGAYLSYVGMILSYASIVLSIVLFILGVVLSIFLYNMSKKIDRLGKAYNKSRERFEAHKKENCKVYEKIISDLKNEFPNQIKEIKTALIDFVASNHLKYWDYSIYL